MTEEQMEKAIETHARRMKAFEAAGLGADDAWDLAEKMYDRDKDGHDDRRVCFECKNYVDKHCIAYTDKFNRATMQLRFVLQRCPKFILKGKK